MTKSTKQHLNPVVNSGDVKVVMVKGRPTLLVIGREYEIKMDVPKVTSLDSFQKYAEGVDK